MSPIFVIKCSEETQQENLDTFFVISPCQSGDETISRLSGSQEHGAILTRLLYEGFASPFCSAHARMGFNTM